METIGVVENHKTSRVELNFAAGTCKLMSN